MWKFCEKAINATYPQRIQTFSTTAIYHVIFKIWSFKAHTSIFFNCFAGVEKKRIGWLWRYSERSRIDSSQNSCSFVKRKEREAERGREKGIALFIFLSTKLYLKFFACGLERNCSHWILLSACQQSPVHQQLFGRGGYARGRGRFTRGRGFINIGRGGRGGRGGPAPQNRNLIQLTAPEQIPEPVAQSITPPKTSTTDSSPVTKSKSKFHTLSTLHVANCINIYHFNQI